MMNDALNSQYQASKRIFLEACEIEDESERRQFIGRECAGDQSLHDAVSHLIEIAMQSEQGDDEESDGDALFGGIVSSGRGGAVVFPTEVLEDLKAAEFEDEEIAIPDRIGKYAIEDLLGSGGMGVVYRARQEEPDRAVALKVIRTHFAPSQVIKRFRYEAEVLGRLKHPGIAQIFEAGTAETPSGTQPYFAMELVDGLPILDYATRHDLTISERLELFGFVCEAVQHAHQNAVIHRDLKPANILVTHDGWPKVFDFGVARLTDADVQTTTMHTQTGQLVGTFQYMSPEQARGNPNDVDMRTDVYALGVILYQLLSGRAPYDLSGKTLPDALRTIESGSRTTLSTVNREFRGDLDTITSKAIEHDKNDRYQSVLELANDVQRYLKDEPILARPASLGYQLYKFTKRNRTLVVSASSALLVLVGVAVILLFVNSQWQKQQNRAEGLTTSIESTIDQINPRIAVGNKKTTEDTLADMIANARAELGEHPLLQAQIFHKAGVTLREIGSLNLSNEALSDAYETRRDELGPDDRETMETYYELAVLRFEQRHLAEAKEMLTKTLDYRRGEYGGRDFKTIEAQHDLGVLARESGHYPEALSTLSMVCDEFESIVGPEDPATLKAQSNLAYVYHRQREYEEADRIFRDTLTSREETLGPEHLDTLESKDNLAYNNSFIGKYEEAERLARESLAARRRILGDTHPETLQVIDNLSEILRRVSKWDEAKALKIELVESRDQYLGIKPMRAFVALNNAANFLRLPQIGEQELAAEALRDARFVAMDFLGYDGEYTLVLTLNLGVLLIEMNDLDEAETTLAEGINNTTRDDDVGQFYVGVFQIYYGKCLIARESWNEAEAPLRAGHQKVTSWYESIPTWGGDEHPQARVARDLLLQLFELTDQPEKAGEFQNDQ